MALANNSLPVPVSPRSSTVARPLATTLMRSITANTMGELLTIPPTWHFSLAPLGRTTSSPPA